MSDMDIHEETEVSKKCFKYKERLFGHINIAYNDSNSLFIFWNRYQIFLHEDQNFEYPARTIVPEFQIQEVIASNNYIICLDASGNIHLTSLKFKNTGPKKFKTSFQTKEQGILHCVKYSPDYVLSIQEDAQTYFLCLHRITADFQLEKKVVLETDEVTSLNNSATKKEIILHTFAISKDDCTLAKAWFKEDIVWKDHQLVLISFDKLTIYACLLNEKDPNEATELVKLYTCPSEICDFTLLDKNGLLIGLITGTILEIPRKNILKSQEPNVIHLNTALTKFVIMKSKDSLIYTDGITLWKSENTYSEESITFRQFFAKDIKDFIKYGEQLICSTYSNLIYTFSMENDTSYLKSDNDTYCPAEKLLNNSEYLYRITQELERNKEIVNKINEEESYITAISLSRRPDLMDNIIQVKLIVYENYQDAVKEHNEITLTENLEKYFKKESILFLAKITTCTIQHALNKILTNLLEDITIHFTFISKGKVLKTTSLKLKDQLKKLDILIPLLNENITKLNVEIKLIRKVPGVLDKGQVSWIVLYKKVLVLNSEHFIKSANEGKKNLNLKEPQKAIEELIQKVAEAQHGDLFKITDVSKLKNTKGPITFYVRLPENYRAVLNNDKSCHDKLNSEKAAMIHKEINSEEFLKSKSNLIYEVSNEKVILEIMNDEFFNPVLKVSSDNGMVALDIRNFFASILYADLEKEAGKEFVSNSLYTTTENLQKALKNSIMGSGEEMLSLSEQFQKNVIGVLPI